jgi:hypothetical protein
VRSVTEIIMMAITPTPPTRSATDESPIMTMKKTPVILLKVSRICSCLISVKSLGSAGRRPRIERIAAVTWSMASDWVEPFCVTTSTSRKPSHACRCFSAVVYGITA